MSHHFNSKTSPSPLDILAMLVSQQSDSISEPDITGTNILNDIPNRSNGKPVTVKSPYERMSPDQQMKRFDFNKVSFPSIVPTFHRLETGIPESNTHSIRKYACNVCHKRFQRPSALQQHLRVHSGEKPFVCEVTGCGKRFSVLSNLKRHLKRDDHVDAIAVTLLNNLYGKANSDISSTQTSSSSIAETNVFSEKSE